MIMTILRKRETVCSKRKSLGVSMASFLDFIWGKKKASSKTNEEQKYILQKKYGYFQSLLHNNNQALDIINDLENLLLEQKPFTFEYVLAQCESLVSTVYDLAEDLNALSKGKYPELFDVTEKLGIKILKGLVRRRKLDKSSLLLPLEEVNRNKHHQVGNKAANLGEVAIALHLTVPSGFSLTAYACYLFLRHNNLEQRIADHLKGLDITDTEALDQACSETQGMVQDADLPADLQDLQQKQVQILAKEQGPGLLLAVRSSATGEDSESSFAGQHSTLLGVPPKKICQAYKEVVASTFNTRAVFYRRSKGYRDSDVLMSVLCLGMIDSRAAGVMYTADPNLPGSNDILLNAAWGLGLSVVEGSLPTDYWRMDRKSGQVLEVHIANKHQELSLAAEQGFFRLDVPENKRKMPSLGQQELQALVDYGKRLEEHFGSPQDVEWCLDRQGRIYILQTRPLQQVQGQTGTEHGPDVSRSGEENFQILLQGGTTAAPGTAVGQAYVLDPNEHLGRIPQGVILIAHQTSPSYVSALSKLAGIITDLGSMTGHMASVAREFRVPTLVGTLEATRKISHLEEITLNATEKKVFKGSIPGLAQACSKVNLMQDSPVQKLVKDTLQLIVPLNLVDPKKENFCPKGCKSLHDVVRFTHEMAMQEMFRMDQDVDEDEQQSVMLRSKLPVNIYLLDLGGGLLLGQKDQKQVAEQEVTSIPLQALIRGMSHQDVQWVGPVGIDLRGFASIVAEGIFQAPDQEEALGAANYCLISEKYMHFNARLGYHFVTIDTYCSHTVHDNYIIFSFKGGAANC